MRNSSSSRSAISGFTLIEVLVALVVLSLGLLGVAALQISSLRTNSSAAQRSQATFLAYDIADRMRANRKAARNGQYNVAYGALVDSSSGTVAVRDLAEWKARIAATFPVNATNGQPADGQILELANRRFAISIRWDDSRGREQPLVFQTQTQM